jgi:hypothetical protein
LPLNYVAANPPREMGAVALDFAFGSAGVSPALLPLNLTGILTWTLFLNYVAAASSHGFRDEAGILVSPLVLTFNRQLLTLDF